MLVDDVDEWVIQVEFLEIDVRDEKQVVQVGLDDDEGELDDLDVLVIVDIIDEIDEYEYALTSLEQW